MAAPNSNHERTYEIIAIDSLELVNETTSHRIFLCPCCLTKTGKDDTTGKLYFSDDKALGLCFRCNTVFFPSEEKFYKVDAVLKRAISKSLGLLNALNAKLEDPSVLKFDFNEPTIDDLKYLRSRNPLIIPLIDYLGLKSWTGSRPGIISPFIYKNYVGGLQVRFKDKAKPKYWTHPGAKIPYSPNHVLSDFKLKREKTVTLCEGVYDAIALLILGYPNPLALLGSSLTDYQSLILRKLMPENAFIAMDEYSISAEVRRTLKSSVSSIVDTQIVTFGGDDPEEFLVKEMKDPEKLAQYVKNIEEIKKL